MFVKEYLIETVKTQVNQVTLTIDEYVKNQNFEIYEKIKEIVINVVNNYESQINDLTTQTTKSYNEYTKALNELKDEKKWWKIFSNISRNNKIDEYNKKLSDLISNFKYKKTLFQIDASEITDLLNQINKSENIIIEDYIYNTITNWTKELNNVSSKIA